MSIHYVPTAYCVTKQQTKDIVTKMSEDEDVSLTLITMIDHAYHYSGENYDGGLSFFDRLHLKLSTFYELSWTPEDLKNQVRNAPAEYMNVLKSITDPEQIALYGV